MSSSFNDVWQNQVTEIIDSGEKVAPRGQPTLELLHRTTVVDMRRPILTVAERKLNYRFMAAEAFWILSGLDTTADIVPWNSKIADFSDDGVKFAGAYGPMVYSQLHYVVGKLMDPDTRQATMTIWRPNPAPSKDIPCTIAIDFKIRQNRLSAHVFMRSSDVWLGLPYDVFNFSMLGHLVCALLRQRDPELTLEPGRLYLTAASSHLYERNLEDARVASESLVVEVARFGLGEPMTPEILYRDPVFLLSTLQRLRDAKAGNPLRWWEYGNA